MELEELEQPGGGDVACWAHLVCSECGAIESEGHRAGCPLDKDAGRAIGD